MKESPQTKRLEDILRSSKLAADGFLGEDARSVSEIIENDLAVVSKSGFTKEQIAARMRDITDKAISLLGNWTEIDQKLLARVDEAKGFIVCPWPHTGRFAKRVTYVKFTGPRAASRESQVIKWSDLNIHFIELHGFFEGKGSNFRIEPKDLINIIF
ncbi:MAG: hypothetical protein JW787_08950 [Sedimentisphaerales bacterium]|nr:hypothetical protein [Sedimentisphaerales bacterium]